MRVADEFKDLTDDAQYRPYRPVPRGLVSLRELAIAGVISAVLQASLALWLAPALLGFMVCVWAYFGLMCKEFWVRDWLKTRPVFYVLSHMVIVPMIGGYAIAVQTVPATGIALNWNLIPFLLTCFCNGLVIEIGRKTRLPAGEEIGVETYSALWGLAMAVRLWLGAVVLTAISSLWAAGQIQTLGVVVPLLMALLGWVGFKAWPWLGASAAGLAMQPSSPSSATPEPEATARTPAAYDLLDGPTALWTLGVYLGLGWLPWFWGGG
ncbi:hypothetical protein [Leptolyngbya sp. BL0902]|uniref:hypothetical protein n=1 Tax=Leptolyngbya sp. BL0902 TaxID=1115757 RepID=UPI003977A79E